MRVDLGVTDGCSGSGGDSSLGVDAMDVDGELYECNWSTKDVDTSISPMSLGVKEGSRENTCILQQI